MWSRSPLTWPTERRAAHEGFVEAVEAAVGDEAVVVALTDLDGFGTLNEELGREAGDRVLDAWTRTLTGSLPAGSLVRRLGGDEYGVAIPGATAETAVVVFSEIRQHLADHPVDGIDRAIDATIGVAARPPHASSIAGLVRCANAAIMRGKREGGGRVAIFVEEKMVLKSNYYERAALDRLAKLAARTDRTEASILREALDETLQKYRSSEG